MEVDTSTARPFNQDHAYEKGNQYKNFPYFIQFYLGLQFIQIKDYFLSSLGVTMGLSSG